jgi:hypothetical protein
MWVQKSKKNLFYKMPFLPRVLLGIVLGHFIAFARFESAWWKHIFNSENLNSKVAQAYRANAIGYYKLLNSSDRRFDLIFLTCLALLMTSFFLKVVSSHKRLWNLIFFISTAGIAAAEVLVLKPLINKISDAGTRALLPDLLRVASIHLIETAAVVFIIGSSIYGDYFCTHCHSDSKSSTKKNQ